MRDTDAAATHIGQLVPGKAENRIAAPSAEVRMAAVQATAEAENRIGSVGLKGIEYFTVQSKTPQAPSLSHPARSFAAALEYTAQHSRSLH
ncbi:MAG: hypothetical protein M3Z54_03335 [Gemmatimonadota bacterium]|nr:hypothetical protein [Gemmatimonadota bacterium]